MAARRVYAEGAWFALPLSGDSWMAGVVARASLPRGRLLGYFFGPFAAIPSLEECAGLVAAEAVMIYRFGEPRAGEVEDWVVLGRSHGWDRREWVVPLFGGTEGRIGRIARYDEVTLEMVSFDHVREDVSHLPADGFSGPLWVQLRLDKLYGAGALGVVPPQRVIGGALFGDGAADWFEELAVSRSLARLRAALRVPRGRYVELDRGDVAVAACAVVALATSGVDVIGDERLASWVTRHGDAISSEDVAQAARVLDRVLGDGSEYAEVWAEVDHAQWAADMAAVRRALSRSRRPPMVV
jgi:hypothetical protein